MKINIIIRTLALFLLMLASTISARATAPISLEIAASPDPVAASGQINYVITVTNHSTTATVPAVKVEGLYPSGLATLFSYNATPPLPNSSYFAGDAMTWSLGDFAPGQSQTIYLSAVASSGDANGTLIPLSLRASGNGVAQTLACRIVAVDSRPIVQPTGSLQFSLVTYSVNENAGTATITVNRVNGSTGDVSVHYEAADGTASAGADYGATYGTLEFLSGQTTGTFTVPIIDDTLGDGSESFTVALSNPKRGATLSSPSTTTVTIVPTYRVTSSAGTNGSISPNTMQMVLIGGSASFAATPATGYLVDRWLVNGSVYQTGGTSVTITNVTSNTTVMVTFKGYYVIGQTITISAGTINTPFAALSDGNNAGGTLNVGGGAGAAILDLTANPFYLLNNTNGGTGTSTLNLNVNGTLITGGVYRNLSSATMALGKVVFNGGTLKAGATSTMFFGNGLSGTGTAAIDSATILAGGATFDTNSFNVTAAQSLLSGIANDGGLTKNGTGTLTLAGSNSYNGGTRINAGTLKVNSDLGLGATSGSVTISNGAVLQAGGSLATARTITLGSGGGKLDTNGNTVSLNGVITGVAGASLVKIGAGTLTLAGTQSYSALTTSAGTTNVNSKLGTGGSTVNANAATNFGASQTLAALNIGAGVTVTFGNGLSLADSPDKLADLGGSGTAVPQPTAAESWRQTHFGDALNGGDGADLATPDHDGIPNLVKYGLVITPGTSGAKSLPAVQTRTYAEG